MKQLSIISALLLHILPTMTFTQEWDFCHPYNNIVTSQAICVNDTMLIYNIKNEFGMACDNYSIYAFDTSGNVIWESFGGNVINHDSSGIYIARYLEMGDVSGSQQISFEKINYSGERSLFAIYPVPDFSEDFIYTPNGISASSSGNILITTPKNLILYNPDGSLKNTQHVSDPDTIITSYFNDADTIILILKNRVSFVDEDFVEIYQFNPAFTIEQSVYHNDTLLLLANNYIYFILDKGSTIDTISIPDTISIDEMNYYDGKIQIGSVKEEGYYLYSIPLQEPESMSQNELATDGLLNITGFYRDQSKTVVYGYNGLGQGALLHYSSESNPKFELPDIELTDFDISNIKLHYAYPTDFESILLGYSFELEMEITNVGNQIIQELTTYYHSSSCIGKGAFNLVEGLSILPGETQKVKGARYSHHPRSGDIYLILFSPNGQMDKSTEDNYLHKEFYINDLKSSLENSFLIYPNPAKDIVNVQNNSFEQTEIKILNLRGELLETIEGNEPITQIDISNFKLGIYIIVVTSQSTNEVQLIRIQ